MTSQSITQNVDTEKSLSGGDFSEGPPRTIFFLSLNLKPARCRCQRSICHHFFVSLMFDLPFTYLLGTIIIIAHAARGPLSFIIYVSLARSANSNFVPFAYATIWTGRKQIRAFYDHAASKTSK
jgi:hypothetical protein